MIYNETMNIEELVLLDYFDLLLYFKKKYGLPVGSYFLTESCKSGNSKISRAKEGLYCHHDKEWNAEDFSCHNLSDPELAREHPFEYQKPYNLTYVNLLEHFLLHLKIHQLRMDVFGCEELDGCEKFLIPQLNDMYQTKKYKKPHLVATKEAIKDNWEDYQLLLMIYSKLFNKDINYLKGLTMRTTYKKVENKK